MVADNKKMESLMEVKEITYARYLGENAKSHPDTVALSSNGVSYTYSELDKITDVFAAKLIQKGIKKNDHVSLWAYNSAEWFISFASIIKAGAVSVLMNYSLPSKDLKDLIDLTDSNFIIYGRNREISKNADAAFELAAECGISKENVLCIDNGEIDFKSFLNDGTDVSAVKAITENDDPHRDAVIIFTTGTTALPKAVLLSQFSIINDGNFYGAKFAKARGNSICNTLPMFHSFGLMVVTLYLHDAKSVYLHEIVKPEEIIKIVDTYHTEDMSGVGAVYAALVEHADFDIKILPYVRICLIGGSVSTPTFMMRLEEKFTHATFLNGYGQTEASPALSQSRPEDPIEKRSTSVGSLLEGAEIKIWTKEGGFLKTGEIGEVVARGYMLMNGYYKLPPEKQAIDSDGWLHTGDLGFVDEDGFLHLTGRIKDIIIKSGENISPVEIEQKIIENPAIKEVKVMGAPHPVTSESIEACISLYEGKTFDEEKMKAELLTKISKFKIPSHFFIFDSFPLLGNGKLDQRTLKAQMLERLKKLRLSKRLENGLYVNTVIIKNEMLALSPVLGLIESFANNGVYEPKQTEKIIEAVKAILKDRIHNAYNETGEITIEMTLFTKFMRLTFSDMGDKYFTEETEETKEASSIILKNVSNYSTTKEEKGKTVYNLDFNFADGFDIAEFLSKSE